MTKRGSFTFGQRLRYRFDNLFAKGVLPVLLALSLALVIIFAIAGMIQTAFSWGPNDQPVSFVEGFWLALTRSLDPGTFGADEGTHFRALGLVITLAGLVALAAMIGLVSSGIDRRIAALQAGRSLVVEDNHTLILGWSAKVPSIVAQLVEANASSRSESIVLLTAHPLDDVRLQLHDAVPDAQGTRIVVRSGDIASLHDLERVNPESARSIVIVSEDLHESDSTTVMCVMAVLKIAGDNAPPLIVEVRERAVADALKAATGSRTIVLVSAEIVAKVAAQVTRTPGLSAIYQELLDFKGSELYMINLSGFCGRSYGELLLGWGGSCPIGIQRADGSVLLNPTMSDTLSTDDRLIVIAEDDSSIGLPRDIESWTSHSADTEITHEPEQERTLIVGWSHYVPLIAQEIDESVLPGSKLDILVDPVLAPEASEVALHAKNQKVRVIPAPALNLDALESLLSSENYRHVLIVCYRDSLSSSEADARAMLALMSVRNHPLASGMNVVTELMRAEDASIAEIAQPDDFVVSERLMSLAMAQISTNAALAGVFRTLLDNDEVSLALNPWHEYSSESQCTFEDVVRGARDRGETAIGWRVAALRDHDLDLGGAIFINPPKNLAASFADDDRIIVLA